MLPIVLNPAHVTVVMFGYGRASKIKIDGIARSGIKCHVVSKEIHAPIANDNVTFEVGAYDRSLLEKGQLVIAATTSETLNAQIASDARFAGKLVLNLSNADDSDFHMMSWRKKGTITLGLSTGNCAPKESKRLVEQLMDTIDDETVERIALLGQLRKKIKAFGIRPLKPIVNQLADYPLKRLIEMNELPLAELEIEINKLV